MWSEYYYHPLFIKTILAGGLYLRTPRRILMDGRLLGYEYRSNCYVCTVFQEVGPQLSSLSWKVICQPQNVENHYTTQWVPQDRVCVLTGLAVDSLAPSTMAGMAWAPAHVAHWVDAEARSHQTARASCNLEKCVRGVQFKRQAFVINKDSVVMLWEHMNILFSETFHPMVLASTDDPYLTQLLHWGLHLHFF